VRGVRSRKVDLAFRRITLVLYYHMHTHFNIIIFVLRSYCVPTYLSQYNIIICCIVVRTDVLGSEKNGLSLSRPSRRLNAYCRRVVPHVFLNTDTHAIENGFKCSPYLFVFSTCVWIFRFHDAVRILLYT